MAMGTMYYLGLEVLTSSLRLWALLTRHPGTQVVGGCVLYKALCVKVPLDTHMMATVSKTER